MHDFDDPPWFARTSSLAGGPASPRPPRTSASQPDSVQPCASPWDTWQNAEHYGDFIEEYPVYRALNRWLVTLAEVGEAGRVLDVACGTGATSEACLAKMGPRAELVGVDIAEAMVGVARHRVPDARAEFRVARARDLRQAVEGPFDRAVCNAAFWQLAAPAQLPVDLAVLLDPGALFVFNVPADRVRGEASAIHPFQIALARALEERTGRPLPPSSATIDPERLEGWLEDAGFDLVLQERKTYAARQEELLELMKIPAMTAPLAPGLEVEARHAAVVQAGKRIDPDQRVEVPWIFFVARRRDPSDGEPVVGGDP